MQGERLSSCMDYIYKGIKTTIFRLTKKNLLKDAFWKIENKH